MRAMRNGTGVPTGGMAGASEAETHKVCAVTGAAASPLSSQLQVTGHGTLTPCQGLTEEEARAPLLANET